MARFAEHTEVPVSKTRDELEKLLQANGAQQRAFITDSDRGAAIVQFLIEGRMIRLRIKYKLPIEFDVEKTGERVRGWFGWKQAQRHEWMLARSQQDERAAWRRLLLVTKAKFEMIASGDETIERQFLPDILLPDGRTVQEALEPQLDAAYSSGQMPPLLPAYGGSK